MGFLFFIVFINMQSLSGLWSYNWGKHCSFRNASMYYIITKQKNVLQNFQLNFTRSGNSACNQLLAPWFLLPQALQWYRRWNNHLYCPKLPSEISCLSAVFLWHQNVPGSQCPGAPPHRLQERRLYGGGAEGNWRLGARQAAINQKAEQSQQDTQVRPPDEICKPAACIQATHSGKIIILWYHLKQSRLGLLPEPAPGFYTCLPSRALAKL